MLHGLVAAQDLAAAACGTLNALYFLHYWLRRRPSPRRRLGAAALAVVNTALVEALREGQGRGGWPGTPTASDEPGHSSGGPE
jgi:hypothetical protein